MQLLTREEKNISTKITNQILSNHHFIVSSNQNKIHIQNLSYKNNGTSPPRVLKRHKERKKQLKTHKDPKISHPIGIEPFQMIILWTDNQD